MLILYVRKLESLISPFKVLNEQFNCEELQISNLLHEVLKQEKIADVGGLFHRIVIFGSHRHLDSR